MEAIAILSNWFDERLTVSRMTYNVLVVLAWVFTACNIFWAYRSALLSSEDEYVRIAMSFAFGAAEVYAGMIFARLLPGFIGVPIIILGGFVALPVSAYTAYNGRAAETYEMAKNDDFTAMASRGFSTMEAMYRETHGNKDAGNRMVTFFKGLERERDKIGSSAEMAGFEAMAELVDASPKEIQAGTQSLFAIMLIVCGISTHAFLHLVKVLPKGVTEGAHRRERAVAFKSAPEAHLKKRGSAGKLRTKAKTLDEVRRAVKTERCGGSYRSIQEWAGCGTDKARQYQHALIEEQVLVPHGNSFVLAK
jgi:hypothetical protein